MNAWVVAFGNLEGKRQFWRTRCRWQDNITIRREINYEVGTGEGWFECGPVMGCCEHGNETLYSVKKLNISSIYYTNNKRNALKYL